LTQSSEIPTLREKFEELKGRNEGAYMAHVYYGDPNEEFSKKLIKTLAENGVDMLELGIPFTDPTADGSTFQAACERALRGGMTPRRCIEGIANLRRLGVNMPIIVTTYYNIPYSIGLERFIHEIKAAGAQAILIPDLSLEESDEIVKLGRAAGVDVIFLIAPTTSSARMSKILEVASGFLYVMNVEGVTGARHELTNATAELIRRARASTDMPLITGFGISKGEHVASNISSGADGIVTGSAIANIYARNLERADDALPEIGKFAQEIKAACKKGA